MSSEVEGEGSCERTIGDKDADSFFKQDGVQDGADRSRQKSVLLAEDSTMARGKIGAILKQIPRRDDAEPRWHCDAARAQARQPGRRHADHHADLQGDCD
ncbi:MAG: hypothetical protein VX293_02880 [Candidatus Latescibacterota bacterium]|nr:hypothetical protein [Candidatus Latescibacterota bacterium]